MSRSPAAAHAAGRRALRAGGLTSGLLLVAAACGGQQSTQGQAPAADGGAGRVSGTITVFAAASLTETFTQLGDRFEKEHPGTAVQLNFGPSSGLAQQINAGAPADVFASAGQKNMDQVTETGAAEQPQVFASNVLEIAVPADNPGKVTGLDDLTRPGLKVALCEEQVPCGTVSAKVFENADIKVTPVTREKDVKSVLTKVRLGEVDAGLVYATDAKAATPDVEGIPIPENVNASTDYPIAVLTKSPNKEGAQAFTDLVLSEQGRSVLGEAGFATK